MKKLSKSIGKSVQCTCARVLVPVKLLDILFCCLSCIQLSHRKWRVNDEWRNAWMYMDFLFFSFFFFFSPVASTIKVALWCYLFSIVCTLVYCIHSLVHWVMVLIHFQLIFNLFQRSDMHFVLFLYGWKASSFGTWTHFLSNFSKMVNWWN